jgi:hypothetical protein
MRLKNAAEPYWIKAGVELLAVKSELPHGEFAEWVKRNFTKSYPTARNYMQLADAQNANALAFPTQREGLREIGKDAIANQRNERTQRSVSACDTHKPIAMPASHRKNVSTGLWRLKTPTARPCIEPQEVAHLLPMGNTPAGLFRTQVLAIRISLTHGFIRNVGSAIRNIEPNAHRILI